MEKKSYDWIKCFSVNSYDELIESLSPGEQFVVCYKFQGNLWSITCRAISEDDCIRISIYDEYRDDFFLDSDLEINEIVDDCECIVFYIAK